MDLQALRALLIRHEGLKNKAYVDMAGKVTIGIGFNLTDVGLLDGEIDFIYNNRIQAILDEVKAFPWFTYMTPNRQLAIMDMIYNMGLGKIQGFKLMIQAIINANYDEASAQMLSSHWADQVGQRAIDLAQMMRVG